MATLFPQTVFKGLLPGIDPKQVQEPFCVSGKNFMLDITSVYTAFGSAVAYPQKLDQPKGVETFELENGGELLLCTASGLYLIKDYNTTPEPLYLFSIPADVYWPWTKAYVGGLHVMCHRSVGLFVYNPSTRVVAKVDPTYLPTNVSFVSAMRGRALVLGDDFYAWSAFDEPTDFKTSSATRAGAQFLSLVGGGEPRALFPVTGGFYVATSLGLIKVTYTDSATLFEHDVVDGERLAPIDPNSWTQIGDTSAVVATNTGLYRFDAQGYNIWQPAMSEHIHRDVTPLYKASQAGVLKLSYLDSLRYLFISMSLRAAPGVYTHAYVHDAIRDEWGSFDQQHTGIGPVPKTSVLSTDRLVGYVSDTGFMRNFLELPQKEADPSGGTVVQPLLQYDPIEINGTVFFSSAIEMTSYDPAVYPPFAGSYSLEPYEAVPVDNLEQVQVDPVEPAGGSDWNRAVGFADWNTMSGAIDWNDGSEVGLFQSAMSGGVGVQGFKVSKEAVSYENLQSNVLIGPYRLIDEQYPHRTSYITDVNIAMPDPVEEVEYVDWNDINGAADWNLLDGFEDWGRMEAVYSNYTASAMPTVDGKQVFNQEVELTAVTVDGDMTHYSVDATGIYHFIRISADEADQAFRLNTLELSGTLGGLL